MALHPTKTILFSRTTPRYFRTFTASSIKLTEDWKGRHTQEHVTNQDHEHNIHASASKSGKKAKAEDASHDGEHKNSQATSEKSTTTAKEEEAKSGRKDRGMGLQDERGGQKSTAEIVQERQANLPLPEDPPVASDWNSADARTVNVSSGSRQDDISVGKASESGLREPATTDEVDSNIGRQGVEGLDGPPKDARAK
ncbi:hypothetical protein MMC10_005876 [Thelotrema lepadinum]|nr:hypothetical protein [Thelotrema lepadinum]